MVQHNIGIPIYLVVYITQPPAPKSWTMALVLAEDAVLQPTAQDVLDRLYSRSTALDGKFACLLCSDRFDSLADLHSHQSYHRRAQGKRAGQRIACPGCGETFDRMQMLQRHYLRKHVDDKLFNCTKCGAGFKVPRPLRT